MNTLRLSIVTGSLMVLLVSCGGGGGGDTSSPPINLGGAAQVNSSLTFQTTGQNLFSSNGLSAVTKQVSFDLIHQTSGPVTRGMIANTQVPLTVQQAQAIWQTVLDTCTSYSYPITVLGVTLATYKPTQNQCINGYTFTYEWCDTFLGPVPGWALCPSGNRKSWNKTITGIGAKPTQGTTRAYDLGMLISSSAELRIGLQGTMTRDFGSVDVKYSAQVALATDEDTAQAGDVVTLITGQANRKPYVMTSRYPNFRLALDMYSYFTAGISTEYAGVNQTTGDPVRKTTTLFGVDSRNNSATNAGTMVFSALNTNLLDMNLNSGGLTVTAAGLPVYASGNQWSFDLTWPLNEPKPAKNAPKHTWPLAFSLAEFSIMMPQLATPAPSNFDCGQCLPLRNDVDLSGTLTNTTPIGDRNLIGGITDGNGWTLPLVNDGHEDVDLVRLDIDADAATLAAGVPLGAIVSDPLGLFTTEINMLDLDLANFISVDQRLNFDPNLLVELRFSVPTSVKGPQDTTFTQVSSKVVTVGESLELLQPASDLTITPVYSLRANKFVNDTKLKVTTAIQETMVQAKFSGFIPDLAGSALGFDPNFALLQLTPQLYSPKVIDSSDTTPWSLDGFSDVVGTPLTIRLQ